MNNTFTTHLYLIILILLSIPTQSSSMISHIKNESQDTITVAFMIWDSRKSTYFTATWDSENKEYKQLNGTIELAPNEVIILDAPIPQACEKISKEPPFDQIPTIAPIYLQIKTRRRTQKKLRRSNDKISCSPGIIYQDATFNIISGYFYENEKNRTLWAQKIVNGKVTILQGLSSHAEIIALTIDANGCPCVTASCQTCQ